MSDEEAATNYTVTCDDASASYTLTWAEAGIRVFQSLEEALDYVQNTSKGARVKVVTPTGQAIFETTV